MNTFPIMSEHEYHLRKRIEVMQDALQKIAHNAGGISDRDEVKRMKAIAKNALEKS